MGAGPVKLSTSSTRYVGAGTRAVHVTAPGAFAFKPHENRNFGAIICLDNVTFWSRGIALRVRLTMEDPSLPSESETTLPKMLATGVAVCEKTPVAVNGLKPYVQNFQNGVGAHCVMLSEVQWKPFWLATGSIAIHRNDWTGWKMVWTMTNVHGPYCCFYIFCMFVCLNVFCRQPYMQSRGARASDHTSLTVIIHLSFLNELYLLPFQEHEGQQLDSRQACPSVPLGEEEPNRGKNAARRKSWRYSAFSPKKKKNKQMFKLKINWMLSIE